MIRPNDRGRAILLAALVVAATTAGIAAIPHSTSAQSIPAANDLAVGADSTTQSFSVDVDVPAGLTVSCTVDTSALRDKGVTIESVSIADTADYSFSASVTSSGDISVTASDSDADDEGTQTTTVTVTATTAGAIPSKSISHGISCGGASLSTLSGGQTTIAQTGSFDLEETGVQDTAKTRVHEEDRSVENDTTFNQSLDLDLIVPDDGDGDGDTFAVTIDTGAALAAGINVSDASVEDDPDGAVEIVGSPTVTDDENVTLTIREASTDRGDGNLSRQVVTVSLSLDATRDPAATFEATDPITYTIDDDTGNTTATAAFESFAQPTVGIGSDTRFDGVTAVTPDDSITFVSSVGSALPNPSPVNESITIERVVAGGENQTVATLSTGTGAVVTFDAGSLSVGETYNVLFASDPSPAGTIRLSVESAGGSDDGDDIPSVYEDASGQVQTDGLRAAISDWAVGDIDTSLLRNVISEWAVGG